MTEYSALLQPDKGQSAHDLHLVEKDEFEEWLKTRPETERQAITAQGFAGKPDQLAIVPGEKADGWSAVLGVKNATNLDCWCLARAAEELPTAEYRLDHGDPGRAAIGWLFAHYRFDRYKKAPEPTKKRILLTSKPAAIEEFVALAEATDLVRTLVNTPAGDMGPGEVENAAKAVADEFSATLSVISGDQLTEGYPMIEAVGRAAVRERRPRLIEIEWGDEDHPRVAIVGKGVCFDTGGLNIKSTAGMRWMKKDMGGAAHALALAQLIMTMKLPVRLHLYLPTVENSIAGIAYRPGDIISSRKGLTVEIGNTDAEGRLILGDALTRACEDKPDVMIDFATLTGAARTALGPDLPALFSDDEKLAAELFAAGMEVDDPVWRLPLWDRYEEFLKSSTADIGNSASTGMAGATTAALFLRKFVEKGVSWAHFDTFAWRRSSKPGRPKGGDALALRASWEMLKNRYGG